MVLETHYYYLGKEHKNKNLDVESDYMMIEGLMTIQK